MARFGRSVPVLHHKVAPFFDQFAQYQAEVRSLNQYDLTGSYFVVQAVQTASTSTTALSGMYVGSDDANYLAIEQQHGTLSFSYAVASSITTLATVSYSNVTHLWWRIREASGTIFWDTSVDNITWTNRASVASPFAVTKLYGWFAQKAAAGTLSPGSFVFNDVNVGSTTANAGLASGTGAANGVTLLSAAGSASGTGAAYNANEQDAVIAGVATGTGTAYGASFVSTAGVAAGTGVANGPTPTVTAAAGLASGTGQAYDCIIPNTGTAHPGIATGTGAAYGAAPVVAAGTVLAAGTGAAFDPSTQLTVPTTSINLPTGSGLANNIGSSATVLFSVATGTGAAFNPIPISGFFVLPPTATGVAVAHDAAGAGTLVTPNGGTGTGLARQPNAGIVIDGGQFSDATIDEVPVEVIPGIVPCVGTGLAFNTALTIGIAVGTGTAYGALPLTTAGTASGTAAAYGINALAAPVPATATGTGLANNPSANTNSSWTASANVAAGLGNAAIPPTSAISAIGFAQGVGAANNVRASDATVVAGRAAGAGVVPGAQPAIVAVYQPVPGTGAALNATAIANPIHVAAAGLPPGTGQGVSPRPQVAPISQTAAGTGHTNMVSASGVVPTDPGGIGVAGTNVAQVTVAVGVAAGIGKANQAHVPPPIRPSTGGLRLKYMEAVWLVRREPQGRSTRRAPLLT